MPMFIRSSAADSDHLGLGFAAHQLPSSLSILSARICFLHCKEVSQPDKIDWCTGRKILLNFILYEIVPTCINMMGPSSFFINISYTALKEFGLPSPAFFLVFYLMIEIGVLWNLTSNFGSRKLSAGVRTEL
jgi:hypothetical protein